MRFGNLNPKKLTLMLLLLAVAVVLIVMYTRNTSNKPVGLTGPSLQVLPVGLTGPSLQVSPVVAAPVVAAPVSGPVPATRLYTYGFCNSDIINYSDPGVLKSSPSEPDATNFTDPRYLGWVDKAAALEKAKGSGAKYISVWLDGTYHSYASCTSIIDPLQRGGRIESKIYVIL